MKKYIQSLRLFFGRVPLRQMMIFPAVVAFFVVLFAGLNLITSNGDFINGMFEGISSMIGPVAAMMGIMQLIAVYNSCYHEVPGYKYFRSVPNSGVQLSRGIIAANALSIISGIAMLALTFVMLRMVNADVSGIILGALLLPVATGICNFTGFLKRRSTKMLVLIGILSMTGFAAGFCVGASEDGEPTIMEMFMQNCLPFVGILAAGLVIFAAGLIFAVNYAKKKWGVDECAE